MTLTVQGIELYETCKELPCTRFAELQKMVAYDLNVGSTFTQIHDRIIKMANMIGQNEHDELSKELINLSNSYYFLYEKLNFKSLSFACLVKSIDGEPVTVIDEESAQKVAERVGERLSQHEAERRLNAVKKNYTVPLISISQMVLMNLKQFFMQKT